LLGRLQFRITAGLQRASAACREAGGEARSGSTRAGSEMNDRSRLTIKFENRFTGQRIRLAGGFWGGGGVR